MLYRWAGAEELDPGSRGPNVDARQFAFVLKVYGIDPDQPGAYTNANPNWHNGAIDGQIFADMMGEMAVRLASQIDYSLQSRSITAGGPWPGCSTSFIRSSTIGPTTGCRSIYPRWSPISRRTCRSMRPRRSNISGLASFLLQGLQLRRSEPARTRP